jgi:hypothetical protein
MQRKVPAFLAHGWAAKPKGELVAHRERKTLNPPAWAAWGRCGVHWGSTISDFAVLRLQRFRNGTLDPAVQISLLGKLKLTNCVTIQGETEIGVALADRLQGCHGVYP